MLAKLRAYEPLRLAVYPVLVLVAGILVTRGVLDSDAANLVIAAVALLLGIPATEVARAKVTPQAQVKDVIVSTANTALGQAESEVRNRLGDQAADVVGQVREQVEAYVGRHRAV